MKIRTLMVVLVLGLGTLLAGSTRADAGWYGRRCGYRSYGGYYGGAYASYYRPYYYAAYRPYYYDPYAYRAYYAPRPYHYYSYPRRAYRPHVGFYARW